MNQSASAEGARNQHVYKKKSNKRKTVFSIVSSGAGEGSKPSRSTGVDAEVDVCVVSLSRTYMYIASCMMSASTYCIYISSTRKAKLNQRSQKEHGDKLAVEVGIGQQNWNMLAY